MSLISVYINGFKNIKDTKIELSKITGLLSINSYGKSNLLAALDFGISFISKSSKSKKRMMAYKAGIPLNYTNKYEDFSFMIEFDYQMENVLYQVEYSYSFKWNISEQHQAQILSEYLKLRNPDESAKYTLYISRNNQESFYKTSQTGRCDNPITIENDELIINKITAYDKLFYLELVKYMNAMNMYLDRHFDSGVSFKPSPIIMKGDETLSIDSNHDIARVLYNIKINHHDKYQLIINTLQTIFPFILEVKVQEIKLQASKLKPNLEEDMPFEITDKVYTLYAQHEHMVSMVNFEQMSDGVRRVLLLLTYIILAQINNVLLIGIEEPENSIHPGLLRKYLIALDNFANECKIIITSHSPFLVNYMNLGDIYIAIPNQSGQAIFRKLKQGAIGRLINNAKSLDMLIGEYIFDLMSGSKDDADNLCRMLENG